MFGYYILNTIHLGPTILYMDLEQFENNVNIMSQVFDLVFKVSYQFNYT